VGLEALRVLSAFLVVLVHAGEPFYIPPDFSVVDTPNARWAALYGSAARCCVPSAPAAGPAAAPAGSTRAALRWAPWPEA